MDKKIAHGNYEHFAYAMLFEGADHALEQAEKTERGQFYNCLNTMLLSAFCVEAYLNHVGPELFRDWDDDVKRGSNMLSKLKIICSMLKLPPDVSKRIYTSAKKLNSFRNLVVHAKTESGTFKGEVDENGDVRVPRMKWERACTIGNAREYMELARDVIRTIHKRAGLPEPALGVVGSHIYSY